MEEGNKEREVPAGSDDKAGLYELGYHIVPLVEEGELDSEVVKVREILDKAGASIVSEGWPKRTALSYSMTKDIGGKRHSFNAAFFGWIKFTARPETPSVMSEALRKAENILRFIILEVPKDTLQPKRKSVLSRGVRHPKPEEEGTKVAEPLSKKAIDEEIEKLVVE